MPSFRILLLLFLSLPLSAQQQASPAHCSPASQQQSEPEQRRRFLGIVSNLGVTDLQHPPPLGSGQKFQLFVANSADPFRFGIVGAQAAISQAEDSFPEYGQGAAGYSKRFGSALADNTSSNFFSNFFYPVLLKQDPRYYRRGQGSVKHRIFYALAQEFVAHTDKGRRSFNFASTLGAFSAGGLSNVYYPPNHRGFGLTLSRAAIALLYGSAGGLLKEFLPDIDRKLFPKQPPDAAPPHPR